MTHLFVLLKFEIHLLYNIENKDLLDAEIEKSANGSYSISYQCTVGETEEEINVLFFKVEPQPNEITYLCCIKANVL